MGRVIRETGDVVVNGVYEIYANIAVDDGSEIAELMQFFKKSEGTNAKFPKLCGRVDYFKTKKGGIKNMKTWFDNYLEEEKAAERAEEQKKGIRGIAKSCLRFQQSPEVAKEAILEEYSDVDEKLIDEIIEEIYGLVKSC